jgi:NAD(P)H-dependent flavin oxidoreductase YrpB (nitropropane dioxygenase family)
MLHTPLCDLFGIRYPILQAPVGGPARPELAAAVASARALGSFAFSHGQPEALRAAIRRVRERTSAPFAVNLLLPWPQEDRVAVCLEERVPVLSLFWGDPTPFVAAAHAVGTRVLHQVGSVEEAERAAAAGVDAVIAQGQEAGGHVRGTIGLVALVPRVVDAISPVPVLAAGGIADGRGIAAALALGAAGVSIGTRFVASAECAAHPAYKDLVVAARETDTVYTDLFDVGWPDAPHRALRNSTYETWEAAGRPPAGRRPGEGEQIATDTATGQPVVRYGDRTPVAEVEGNVEAMALYAGQGCGLIDAVQPAADIVAALVAETEAALHRLAALGPR